MKIQEITNYLNKFRGYTVTPRVNGKIAEIKESLSRISSDPIPVCPAKIDNTKGIRLNTVYCKIRKLEEVIDSINIEANKLQWLKPEECPLEILDDHWRLSHILTGGGSREWNCPFCNKREMAE